jgi:hypothetical protein
MEKLEKLKQLEAKRAEKVALIEARRSLKIKDKLLGQIFEILN